MEKKDKYRESDFELMAPVGSYESLQAAIHAGADSVYFGISKLNMRSGSAANFGWDDLSQITSICREAGVKSYLTLNTILYDDDLALMREIIDRAKESEVSAIIASDVAAMTYAAERGVAVHLSTQLNITNAEALSFYARFADVVVLARELNLDQVSAIHRAIEEQPIQGPNGRCIHIIPYSTTGMVRISATKVRRRSMRYAFCLTAAASFLLSEASVETINLYPAAATAYSGAERTTGAYRNVCPWCTLHGCIGQVLPKPA